MIINSCEIMAKYIYFNCDHNNPPAVCVYCVAVGLVHVSNALSDLALIH